MPKALAGRRSQVLHPFAQHVLMHIEIARRLRSAREPAELLIHLVVYKSRRCGTIKRSRLSRSRQAGPVSLRNLDA
jgi:hypothetical protein